MQNELSYKFEFVGCSEPSEGDTDTPLARALKDDIRTWRRHVSGFKSFGKSVESTEKDFQVLIGIKNEWQENFLSRQNCPDDAKLIEEKMLRSVLKMSDQDIADLKQRHRR